MEVEGETGGIQWFTSDNGFCTLHSRQYKLSYELKIVMAISCGTSLVSHTGCQD